MTVAAAPRGVPVLFKYSLCTALLLVIVALHTSRPRTTSVVGSQQLSASPEKQPQGLSAQHTDDAGKPKQRREGSLDSSVRNAPWEQAFDVEPPAAAAGKLPASEMDARELQPSGNVSQAIHREAESKEDAQTGTARVGAAVVGSASQAPSAGPSRSEQEAEIIQRMCSEEEHARTVKGVLEEGKGPPVMSWGCENEMCGGEFVRRTINYLRLTPRFRSLLTLVPCDVWRAVRGRTIWLAGDSQSQRFYRQLRCFLGGFMEAEPHRRRDVRLTEDPEEAKRIHQAVLEGHDSCCGVDMPICTYFVGEARVCHARINKGDHMLKYLRNLDALGVRKDDVWEFNIGLWHHKKENEYPGLTRALAEHYSKHKGELPLVIWRDNSPQHFKIENGEFPHPSVAWKILEGRRGCQPISGVQLLPDGSVGGSNRHVQAGGWRNQITTPLFRGVGMPIHGTWNDSLGMWAGHVGQDCTHFCSPGAYNVWVWSLWHTLLKLGVHGDGPEAAAAAYEATLQQQREAEQEAEEQQQQQQGAVSAADDGDGSVSRPASDPPVPALEEG